MSWRSWFKRKPKVTIRIMDYQSVLTDDEIAQITSAFDNMSQSFDSMSQVMNNFRKDRMK